MDADQIGRACARMAHQGLEANRGAEGLVVLGIPTRGVALAERLARAMAEVEGVDIPVGALGVTFYRDHGRPPTPSLSPRAAPPPPARGGGSPPPPTPRPAGGVFWGARGFCPPPPPR